MKKEYLPWDKCAPAKSTITVGNLTGNATYRSYRRRGMGLMPMNRFWKEFRQKRLNQKK